MIVTVNSFYESEKPEAGKNNLESTDFALYIFISARSFWGAAFLEKSVQAQTLEHPNVSMVRLTLPGGFAQSWTGGAILE